MAGREASYRLYIGRTRRTHPHPLSVLTHSAIPSPDQRFGAVWDVYRVLAVGPSSFPFPLVAGMIRLVAFPLEVDPTRWFDPYSRESLSQDDIRVKDSNELFVLANLAGIPHIHKPCVVGLRASL